MSKEDAQKRLDSGDWEEGIMKMLDNCPLHAEADSSFVLMWSKPGVGFGEATFYSSTHEKGGDLKWYCDSETMSRDFVKEMLCQMVDECIFTDEK